MAIQEFRCRVNGHVGTKRDWLLEKWRHESVVHDQLDLLALRNLRNAFNVAQRHQRVGWRFYIDHARALADRSLDVARDGCINVGELKTVSGKNLIEEARNTSIKIIAADDVVAGFVHGANSVNRRHPTGENA